MSKGPYRILVRRKGAGGIQIWNDGGNGSIDDGDIDQFYVWYDLAIAKQDSGRIAHNFDAPLTPFPSYGSAKAPCIFRKYREGKLQEEERFARALPSKTGNPIWS